MFVVNFKRMIIFLSTELSRAFSAVDCELFNVTLKVIRTI